MINLANLIKPGVIPAVAERFRVKGMRTNLTTGVATAVRCEAELRKRDTEYDEWVLWIVEGGVTGYESFLVSDLSRLEGLRAGWYACAGTEGRWAQLYIDAENMSAMADWILRKIKS